MKSFKAANQDGMRNTKVKTNVSGKFKKGVYAILSENILLMKKTNRLLTISDIVSMGLYIVITIFSD